MREPGYGLSFSPEGNLIAVPSFRSVVQVFDWGANRPVMNLGGYMFGVHSCIFSADGTRLASGGTAIEAVVLWDTQSQERVLTLAGRVNTINSLAFSPDGSALVGRGTPTNDLHFWRAPSWAEIEQAERAFAAEGALR